VGKHNLHSACDIVPIILENEVGLRKPEYLRIAAEEIRALAGLFDEEAKFIEENPEHSAEHLQSLIIMELSKHLTKH
jgi:hypothetical protein